MFNLLSEAGSHVGESNASNSSAVQDASLQTPSFILKPLIIQSINEYIQELGSVHELVSEQALEHIHQRYSFFLPRLHELG